MSKTTSRNEVASFILPFSVACTCQLLSNTKIQLISSKYLCPYTYLLKLEEKKSNDAVLEFQSHLGKPLNDLIETTPSVNFV